MNFKNIFNIIVYLCAFSINIIISIYFSIYMFVIFVRKKVEFVKTYTTVTFTYDNLSSLVLCYAFAFLCAISLMLLLFELEDWIFKKTSKKNYKIS